MDIAGRVINKVLGTKDITLLTAYDFDKVAYGVYIEVKDYIVEYHNQYGVVPDKLNVVDEFEDFPVADVFEPDEALIDGMFNKMKLNLAVIAINKGYTMLGENTENGVEYLINELNDIHIRTLGRLQGRDIVKGALSRMEAFVKAHENEGLLGLSTGLSDLDELTHGWLPGEDLITIVGRPNEGKSWILLFFLVQAWLTGKKVLLYSGEMSANVVGYRFDTFVEHFSNLGLMSGSNDLGDGFKMKDYENYINRLKDHKVPFIVVTPKDLGNKPMTVPMLKALIEKEKPDIVGIDQFSLMADARAKKGDPTRIQLAHISEDLFRASEKYGIPIIADAQASRKSNEKKDNEEATPELEHIQESDAIGQNSTRVLTIKQTSAGLKLSIKKNRYGINNRDLTYFWDIDHGVIKLLKRSDADVDVQVDEEYNNGEDVF